MRLRLGTRASTLARWQANWIADRLRAAGHETDLVFITTRGDTTQAALGAAAVALSGPVGPFGLFTKELQAALLNDQIDLAVHSLKDLPTDATPGLTIAAVAERASPFDVLISSQQQSLEALPSGAVLGTGSLRRSAQLLHLRPDLRVVDVRGNVDSRLKKLDEGQLDALILAEAGMSRLGMTHRITQVIPPEIMVPAAGQGALGIETRDDDRTARQAVAILDHLESRTAAFTERALLAALSGGCLAPIGAYCVLEDGLLRLRGCVLSPDGQVRIHAAGTAPAGQWAELANGVAANVIDQGADRLIEQARALD